MEEINMPKFVKIVESTFDMNEIVADTIKKVDKNERCECESDEAIIEYRGNLYQVFFRVKPSRRRIADFKLIDGGC
jgi:hypothetical protein